MNPAGRSAYAFKPRAVPVVPSSDDIDAAVAKFSRDQTARYAQLLGVLTFAVEYLAVESHARRRTETIRMALAHIAADARISEEEQARFSANPTSDEPLNDDDKPGDQS